MVYSDWLEDDGGNKERTAFLFDRRAVIFNGLAAEVDAPRGKKGTEYLATQSFWRAPYMCSFRAGNFDFIVIATHARWGGSIEGRQAELQMLADWVDTRFTDKFVEDHDLIVMGDFNVPKTGDKLFKAQTNRGLQVPDMLVNLRAGDQNIGGSNLGKNAQYDQILHLPTLKKRFSNEGGTLDFSETTLALRYCSRIKVTPARNSAFSSQITFHFGCRSRPTSTANDSIRLYGTARKYSQKHQLSLTLWSSIMGERFERQLQKYIRISFVYTGDLKKDCGL